MTIEQALNRLKASGGTTMKIQWFILAALSVTITSAESFARSTVRPLPSKTSDLVLEKEITRLIESAKAFHLNVSDYATWHESKHQPEALAQQLEKWSTRDNFYSVFCGVLEKINRKDLFYVSDFLEMSASDQECVANQYLRYDSFLTASSYSILQRSELRSIKKPYSLQEKSTLGPSEEVFLDAKATPVVVDGHLPDKTIALTFDDGPHATRTKQLLELLKTEDAQVQFFLVGRNTRLYPDLVNQMDADKHEVGCHSFTHPDMRKLSFEAATKEIEDGFLAIQNILLSPRTIFRFPYGAKTDRLRNYMLETETPEFFWNIDTLDWKYPDPEFLFDYAMKQIRSERRGIVLFHDIQPQTLAIMPGVLSTLKAEGYKLAVFRPTKTRKTPAP